MAAAVAKTKYFRIVHPIVFMGFRAMGSYYFRGLGLAAVLLLSACGGDSSSTPSPPPPANRLPTLTLGAASASVTENSSGTLVSATASDPDGDAITFTLSGADAGFFSIDASGNLSFSSAPNYDLYADSNADNVYELVVEISDGRGGRATAPFTVTVNNDGEGIAVTRIITGLVEPVGIAPTFETGSAMAVGLADGNYILFEGSRSEADPVAAPTVVSYMVSDFERLLDITWGQAGSIWSGPSLLYRSSSAFSVFRPGGVFFDGEITDASDPEVKGRLFTAPSGHILASLGDPSGNFAQNPINTDEPRFGRLFRLEPSCGASVISICIVSMARGVRQPGGIAAVGDSIIFADQGGTVAHELNVFPRRTDATVTNMGWPFLEGTQVLETGAPSDVLSPSLTYGFGSGIKQGEGAVMGSVYSGPIASLDGQLVFGDINGAIFSIPWSSLDTGSGLTGSNLENRTEDFLPDQGTIDQILDIASDDAGVLYILDSDGEVFRVDGS